MQSLGAFVLLPDAAPATGLALKTEFIGNKFQRWAGGFDVQQGNYPVQWLAVRWDGDKVRGFTFRLYNGFRHTEGDFSAQFKFSEIYFSPGETLASLTLKDSGYGYGSLRRIEMTTSGGKSFSAGPEGFDSVRRPAVAGGILLGFYGLVNIDKFMQSLGANVIYAACGNSGIQLLPDDDSEPTPVTDLIGLKGPEQFCSTSPSTCTAPPLGNRRLLWGTRRSLVDLVTKLSRGSTEYEYFRDTVALYNYNISDRVTTPTITLFTNTRVDASLSWRIDRQQSSNRNGIRYNLLAVQGGLNRQRGQTFASVLVPDRYYISMRKIRNAFILSQRNGETVVVGTEGGFAADWSQFLATPRCDRCVIPPQTTPPPGVLDYRVNGYMWSRPIVVISVTTGLTLCN
ncbi:hypothetical protein M758_1G311600 [Ceratodon purpureus]|nr:hypothetical protein M758_1G311600 [Ceratodon purpureus]